jgi:hypothetical protein
MIDAVFYEDIKHQILEFSNPVKDMMRNKIFKNFNEKVIVEKMIKDTLIDINEEFDLTENPITINDIKYKVCEIPNCSWRKDNTKYKIFCKIVNMSEEQNYQLEYDSFVIHPHENLREWMMEYVDEYLYSISYECIARNTQKDFSTSKKVFDKMVEKLDYEANDIIKDMIENDGDYSEVISGIVDDLLDEQGLEYRIDGASSSIYLYEIDVNSMEDLSKKDRKMEVYVYFVDTKYFIVEDEGFVEI